MIASNVYLYLGGEGSSHWMINVQKLDYEVRSEYTLTVLAYDGLRYAKSDIVVQVINRDDSDLHASQPSYETHVAENSEYSDALLTVKGNIESCYHHQLLF